MGTRLRTARKLLLGREIEHMVRAAGVSQAEAGKIIESTQSRINQLINGVGAISVSDLELLTTTLGFTDPGYIDTLKELRRDNHKRGFWTTGHRRAYVEDLRLLVDLEAHASLLRTAEAEIMPGLIQCEPYIRALHEPVTAVGTDGVTVDESVRARLARQQVLTEPDPPEFRAILSESCLRREYGGRGVMLEQLEHLSNLSRQPNILIQVLPFTITTHGAGMEDRYTLIRVPSPGAAGDLEMAIVQSQGDIRYIDDKPMVAVREAVWSRLSAVALGAEDSRQFMEHVARSFRRRTFTGTSPIRSPRISADFEPANSARADHLPPAGTTTPLSGAAVVFRAVTPGRSMAWNCSSTRTSSMPSGRACSTTRAIHRRLRTTRWRRAIRHAVAESDSAARPSKYSGDTVTGGERARL